MSHLVNLGLPVDRDSRPILRVSENGFRARVDRDGLGIGRAVVPGCIEVEPPVREDEAPQSVLRTEDRRRDRSVFRELSGREAGTARGSEARATTQERQR